MRAIGMLVLLLCGCASHTVRCDGHLVPVNLPASRASVAATIAGGLPDTTAKP